MKEEVVIAKDVAESTFEEWADINGVDTDTDDLNEDELLAFNNNKKALVKACMAGRLVLEDNGSLIYTISNYSGDGFRGEKLTIGVPTGKVWTAMDGFKDNERMKKIVNCMTCLTGKDKGFFNKLHAVDWRVVQAVVIFFLNI